MVIPSVRVLIPGLRKALPVLFLVPGGSLSLVRFSILGARMPVFRVIIPWFGLTRVVSSLLGGWILVVGTFVVLLGTNFRLLRVCLWRFAVVLGSYRGLAGGIMWAVVVARVINVGAPEEEKETSKPEIWRLEPVFSGHENSLGYANRLDDTLRNRHNLILDGAGSSSGFLATSFPSYFSTLNSYIGNMKRVKR